MIQFRRNCDTFHQEVLFGEIFSSLFTEGERLSSLFDHEPQNVFRDAVENDVETIARMAPGVVEFW